MRGSILQKKNSDKWYIVVDYYNASGKRKQKWFSGYNREKDAEKDLPRILKMMNENQYVEETGITVNEMIENYINYKKTTLRPLTISTYEGILNNYIGKHIGNIKLSHLKGLDIQNMYNDIIENHSAKTVRNINCLLNVAIKQSQKLGLIAINPCEQVTLPTIKKKKINVLSKDEVNKILDYSKDKEYYLPLFIAFSTGMRRGELCGLEYEDIDFENNIINIRRARLKTGVGITELKTDKSYRSIAITDELKNAILDNIDFHKHQKETLGSKYFENNMVCKCNDGRIFNVHWIYKKFKEVLKELNLNENIRFHDIRHTHATMLVNNNVNMKIIQERLGHSSISTTADIYSHPNVEAQRDAIKGLF